ncbi:uncharacterized protein C227.17c isoform X2 [Brassica napus]|uniref:uncharacterized protein C227.17c isoform X2 n=1 Tax=Brassica napus TaxID=3708 RepID=UPI00207862D6|nr:uncharacterized protein C227.17c isoform X2 [Brassica napus]
MSTEMEEYSAVRRRVSCTKYFDALWFCYSPYYQMQQYYRVGKLDDCTKKFSALFDCLSLKTKSASEAEVEFRLFMYMGISVVLQNKVCRLQKIMEEQEKADAAKHIWIMRTQEEASSHWNETFGHLDDPNY